MIAQPGLTAEDVAPPLLVFKAYEAELGVAVRVPQALSAIPRGEQIRLRDALGIEREDFAKAIDELKTLAAADATEKRDQQIVRDAEASHDKEEATSKTGPKKKAPPSKQKYGADVELACVDALTSL